MHVRRPDNIDYSQASKYWLASCPISTAFGDMLSIIIPEYERFFIRTVRESMSESTDSIDTQRLKTFIQQEAHHYKVHEEINASRIRFGLNPDAMTGMLRGLFVTANRYLPLSFRLGMTAFMEHFTAAGAHAHLACRVNEHIDDGLNTYWVWHSVEEIEHKAVAFDLYIASGGSYATRLFSALFTLFINIPVFVCFYLLILWGYWIHPSSQPRLSKKQKALRTAGRKSHIRALLKSLYISCDYFRPNFHPWDLDDSGLAQQFSSKYLQDGNKP